MSTGKITMNVIDNKPTVEAELTYEDRRKHLRSIIFNNSSINLKEVVQWLYEDEYNRNNYKYVHGVLKGYPGKKSKNILNKIERELRDRGYYVEL